MPPPEIAPHHFDALALHRHRETKTVGGRLTGHGSNVALRETVEDPYRLRDAIAPLNRVFFGGRTLKEGDDYFVVLVTPAEVKEIAAALAGVTEAWLRSRYFDVPFPDYQGEKSEEDWQYTLGNFEGLPEFFAHAAREGRHVIFTVDQ